MSPIYLTKEEIAIILQINLDRIICDPKYEIEWGWDSEIIIQAPNRRVIIRVEQKEGSP